MIWGKGLVRSGSQSRTKAQSDALGSAPSDPRAGPFGYPNPRDAVESGWANKSISLKLCRNVIIRDISILHGGHFAILATGVDNLTIDNLKIDTNRDGICPKSSKGELTVQLALRRWHLSKEFVCAGLCARH